ncbi:MAG: hypothetical protein ETSY2_31295 [Candidatus Entotheonella gemina]|uniref:Uncharacterized protein n=1 Tax=Candidatus Entotheonella gemina TaxID=1429439 RepID=W4M2Z3_9BACT|nr:MAG: hypothetical protein ETSY2_31295 [Candidatus Entotheonella gemina]
MMNRNHHQIVRSVLELELASAARATELQESVARLFQDRVLPELETLFDRLADPDAVLRVDRLEIDLGDLKGADWQEHFYTKLLQQLESSLERAAHAPEAESQREREREQVPEGRGALPFQRLLFVLAHGRLPWWGEKPEKGWTEECLQQLDAKQWQTLGNLHT